MSILAASNRSGFLRSPEGQSCDASSCSEIFKDIHLTALMGMVETSSISEPIHE